MQTDDIKSRLISQLKEFLSFTVDTDNDTIVSQYTLIDGLVDQLSASYKPDVDANYDYFLTVNTAHPQPVTRKLFALEGIQERFRGLLKKLHED
jgi:hypothetical protein